MKHGITLLQRSHHRRFKMSINVGFSFLFIFFWGEGGGGLYLTLSSCGGSPPGLQLAVMLFLEKKSKKAVLTPAPCSPRAIPPTAHAAPLAHGHVRSSDRPAATCVGPPAVVRAALLLLRASASPAPHLPPPPALPEAARAAQRGWGDPAVGEREIRRWRR